MSDDLSRTPWPFPATAARMPNEQMSFKIAAANADPAIVFTIAGNAEPAMRLDKDGMTYKGARIEDAGEAYRAFIEVMTGMRLPQIGLPQRDAHRADAMEELLRSAHAIAERKGADTAWERFADSIRALGIGSVTARTYRVLPSDRSI